MTGTVTTNGIFDVLHAGHFSLLKFAKSLGDRLIVLINSDESVKRLRGKPPLMPQAARKFALEGIRWVDEVRIFEADDPLLELEGIRPNFHVKGGDYDIDELNERDVVEYHEGAVIQAPVLMIATTGGEQVKMSSSYVKDELIRRYESGRLQGSEDAGGTDRDRPGEIEEQG